MRRVNDHARSAEGVREVKWSSDSQELETHAGRLPDGAIPLYVVSTVVYIDNDGDKRYNMRIVAPEDAYPQVADVVGTCAIAQWIAADDMHIAQDDDD